VHDNLILQTSYQQHCEWRTITYSTFLDEFKLAFTQVWHTRKRCQVLYNKLTTYFTTLLTNLMMLLTTFTFVFMLV